MKVPGAHIVIERVVTEQVNVKRWLQLLSLRLDAYAFVRAVINEMVSMGKNQSSVD